VSVRAYFLVLFAAFSSGCAAAKRAAEAAPAVQPPTGPRPAGEYERILGTFSVKIDAAIYLTPRLLERAYDDDNEEGGAAALQTTVGWFQRLGHKRGEAAARLNRGAVLWKLGQGDAAYRELDEARKLFAGAGDLEGEAHAHEWLGFFFRESGEKELAEDHLALAYQMFQKLENAPAAERILSYGD
jgi:tetratricopeptide (TPR) repeat protein